MLRQEWDLNSCHWILSSCFYKVPHLSSFWCHLSTSGLIYHSSRVHLPILVFPNCPLPNTQLDQRNCSKPTLIISQFLLKGTPRSPIINKLRFCSLTFKCPHPAASLICPLSYLYYMLQPNRTPCSSWHVLILAPPCLFAFPPLKRPLQSLSMKNSTHFQRPSSNSTACMKFSLITPYLEMIFYFSGLLGIL